LAVLTTQQILSFIQYKIAATHAAGEDICALLANPEVAFSLQVLEGNYNNLMQAPGTAVGACNIDRKLAQQLVMVGTNTKDGLGQTPILLF
jgi:alkyl sulfatase BDS1-like metallo-beta-lactamase superfamily hydrolase